MLKSDNAALLGDLSLVLLDLRSVIDICRRLSRELEKSQHEQDNLMVEALWTAALVKYIRCFATGKRFGLDVSVFDGFSGALNTHQYFKDMRDKHVVHSVNPFEDVSVSVVLRGEPGAELAEGIAVFQHRLICTDQNGVQTLEQLAAIAQKNVRLRCKKLRDDLSEWAKSQPAGTFERGQLGMVAPGPEQAGETR